MFALTDDLRAVITPNAMEFSRLVKAVLHKDVAPAVNPDPRLVEDLATAMGHITILHKGCPDLISNGKVRIFCFDSWEVLEFMLIGCAKVHFDEICNLYC